MVKEVKVKSILNRHKRIDSWFLSAYGMNLYRGCMHNCVYCDGRNEKYRVDGEFGADIKVKGNAPELLERALDPKGKRTVFKSGYIMVGGGVGDSYQPPEKEMGLTRRILGQLSRNCLPVHLLTKSSLIKRDGDIIKTINDNSGALVSMSFSTVDDELAGRFEPGCSSPSERLRTLAGFKEQGIPIGMFLMPVIPFLSDSEERIRESLLAAKAIDIDFVIFGAMTLKPGRQKEHYMSLIHSYYPELKGSYEETYMGNAWGNARSEYNQKVEAVFARNAKTLKIPRRIPPRFYKDILHEDDKISIMLEHLDYCLKQDGRKSPYGFAAYQISRLQQPLREIRDLQSIKGVGQVTERIIKEIIETGTSAYLETVI